MNQEFEIDAIRSLRVSHMIVHGTTPNRIRMSQQVYNRLAAEIRHLDLEPFVDYVSKDSQPSIYGMLIEITSERGDGYMVHYEAPKVPKEPEEFKL